MLKRIWEGLDGKVQVHQNHVLALLQEKLQGAITIIDGLSTSTGDEPTLKGLIGMKGDSKKLQYAIHVKGRLDKIVTDLDEWQKRFDPSWYLLARAANPAIDRHIMRRRGYLTSELSIVQELRNARPPKYESWCEVFTDSVFLPENYSLQARKAVPHSSASIGCDVDGKVVIDNCIVTSERKDMRDVARLLGNVDPNVFGLLACRGVLTIRGPVLTSTYELIFKLQAQFDNPRSLRTILLENNHQYTLDDRFRLAKRLARSVLFLHSASIVHKCICPESVLVLNDSQTDLDEPFLVGFQKFRFAYTGTRMCGDNDWQKNLYRHPERQGDRPKEGYKMQHDIYSLGICLLEIGVGASFVRFEAVSERSVKQRISHQKISNTAVCYWLANQQ